MNLSRFFERPLFRDSLVKEGKEEWLSALQNFARVSEVIKKIKDKNYDKVHQQQFFSELHSPGRSHYTNYWYSWVQTIYFIKSMLAYSVNKEKLSILTLLLEHTTLWWYLQWPSGVSSLFSVSALAVYNHYLKILSFLIFFSNSEGGAPWVGWAPLGRE